MSKEISIQETIHVNYTDLLKYTCQLAKNKEDAHDILQDALFRALTHTHLFEEGTNILAWVKKIIYNLFITTYHIKKRRQTIFVNMDQICYSYMLDNSFSPTSDVSLHYIEAAVITLPLHLQQPIKLYSLGYKYSEIAEYMRVPEGTIKSRIWHARKALKRLIQDI